MVEIPENATEQQLDAILMDGAKPVSDQEMGRFFAWVAEGVHAFVRTLNDPHTCFYCGQLEGSADHVPTRVSPEQSHERI